MFVRDSEFLSSMAKDVDLNARVKPYWCNGGLNQLWALLLM